MFKLYGEIAGWKMLDLSADEFDIIATMGEYLQENENIRFLIIKSTDIGDEPYKSIRSMQQYIEYSQEYYERTKLENKNIMELKKEMMDIVYEKPKTKKIGETKLGKIGR